MSNAYYYECSYCKEIITIKGDHTKGKKQHNKECPELNKIRWIFKTDQEKIVLPEPNGRYKK